MALLVQVIVACAVPVAAGVVALLVQVSVACAVSVAVVEVLAAC